MTFDRKHAEGSLVEILDGLNGDRIIGMGFRLIDDTIATSSRCLPRPMGRVSLPDPDAPGVLALVRVRKLGTHEAASAITTAVDPWSGLALLRSSTASGLTVPDELNPIIPIEKLIEQLEPALPALAPPREARVFLWTHERRWAEGTATSSTVSMKDPAVRIQADMVGAPVFDEHGRVVGIVTFSDETGLGARLCTLAEHLPGWAVRKARDAFADVAAAPPSGQT